MQRSTIGTAAVIVGATLAASSPALAQAAASGALPGSWAYKLAILANLIKVVEGGAFVFGAYQFWMGRRERNAADADTTARALIDSNYQAWQVINSAQGKGGSGGRIEALAALLRNGVSLAGITLDDAWLESVQLPGAMMPQASLQRTHLAGANLARANLDGANLRGADLAAVDLSGASLRRADVTDARISAATLDGADLTDIVGWESVRAFGHASIRNVLRAPAGFIEHAIAQGAVNSDAREAADNEASSYSREFRSL